MSDNSKEYSIGETAKLLNVPVHTIRFWTDEFDHIECRRRNNRRYYDFTAVEELKKIKELSHKKGVKIDGIKQMIRYRKIDMEKINIANQTDLKIKIESSIKKIDKIIEILNKI